MQATKIRLRFTAPLHIAARGVGFERVGWIIHSDTLYSAIFTVWSHIFPDEVGSYIGAASPPFLLSSAFPFQGQAEFYPKPLAPMKLDIDRKHFSRVQFIEAELFQEILSGGKPSFDPKDTRQNGRFWIKPNPDKHVGQPKEPSPQNGRTLLGPPETPIMHEVEVPRVVIDRITNQGMLYYVSELHFGKNAGLFFWVRFNVPDIRSRLMQVLRVLGDEGIGLDRSSGKGLFKVNDDDISDEAVPGPNDAARFLTLSLFHPQEEEVKSNLLHCSGYELVQRGGYVSGRSYRRKTLTMFTEGSVFSGSPTAAFGDKEIVLPQDFEGSTLNNSIYRYGYAFPIGFHAEE